MSDRDRPFDADWCEPLAERLPEEYWDSQVRLGEHGTSFYPPPVDVFRALELTWFRDTRVVIVGQDPYPNEGQADGLCFSVRPGASIPPSLCNIRKELRTDQPAATIPEHGSLDAWAREGVLLLNTALTVCPGEIGSHLKRWKPFTDEVIKVTSDTKADRVVFMLWGCNAQKKAKLIDESRHTIIRSSHPSPRSASRPCRGSPPFSASKPFSKANEILTDSGQALIDWSLS